MKFLSIIILFILLVVNVYYMDLLVIWFGIIGTILVNLMIVSLCFWFLLQTD